MIPLQDENPTRITPYVTWALIAFNIIIYLMQATGGMVETQAGLRGTLAGFTMIPVEVTQGIDLPINGPTLQPAFLTIFSAMFLHGGLLHLGGNMLFLLIFGNNIEDVLGHAKYLFFYLACGFFGRRNASSDEPGLHCSNPWRVRRDCRCFGRVCFIVPPCASQVADFSGLLYHGRPPARVCSAGILDNFAVFFAVDARDAVRGTGRKRRRCLCRAYRGLLCRTFADKITRRQNAAVVFPRLFPIYRV